MKCDQFISNLHRGKWAPSWGDRAEGSCPEWCMNLPSKTDISVDIGADTSSKKEAEYSACIVPHGNWILERRLEDIMLPQQSWAKSCGTADCLDFSAQLK